MCGLSIDTDNNCPILSCYQGVKKGNLAKSLIFILVSIYLHLQEVEPTSSAIRLSPETNITQVGSVLTSGRATERDILLVVQSCFYNNKRT